MHQVVIGAPEMGLSEANKVRCRASASHLRWDGDRLFIKGNRGEECHVIPWKDRKKLIRDMAAEIGFPGGKRLYQLAKVKYY